MWKIPHLGGYGPGHFVSVGTILVRRVLFPKKFQDQLLYIVRCEQVGGESLTPEPVSAAACLRSRFMNNSQVEVS